MSMQVEDLRQASRVVRFENLSCGTFFIYADDSGPSADIRQKIEPTSTSLHRAVNLSYGNIETYDPHSEVLPIDINIQILKEL